MGIGVLEDRKTEFVPGTALLGKSNSESSSTEERAEQRQLKRSPKSNVILVPQPSDDPNDPYNWSRMRKELFTLSFVLGCGAVGAVGPLLGPAYVQLSESYNVSLSTWNIGMQGGPIACIAFGSLIWNALAVKYGKRPVYLITALGLMVTCFWAAASKSLTSLIISRLITGFCMAPLEALVPASIADVWCVHERGFRSALFNLGVLGGINLASVISGPIIQYAGYRAAFYAMGGAFGIHLIMVIFWMPETAFHRHTVEADHTFLQKDGLGIPKGVSVAEIETKGLPIETTTTDRVQHPPASFGTRLMPYSGYKNNVSFWNTLVRPFAMILCPAVFWASILFATCISWLVGIAISLSQIFSAPPYNFSITAVGAINASPFVASVLGMVVAGPLIDSIIKILARRNGGVYEPEFRLPIMFAYLAFTGSGFFAWGQSGSTKAKWPIPVILCLGFINFGIQLGATGVITYVVDCYRDQAEEALAMMNFVKNMFAFGLVFYMNDWIVSHGIRSVFFSIGGITIGVSLTAIPMYIFGKRARALVYRWNILGTTYRV